MSGSMMIQPHRTTHLTGVLGHINQVRHPLVRFAAAPQPTNEAEQARQQQKRRKLGNRLWLLGYASLITGLFYPNILPRVKALILPDRSWKQSLNETEKARLDARVKDFNTHRNITFEFFVPDSESPNGYKQVQPDDYLKQQQNQVAQRIVEVLWERPDLLEQIQNLPNGLVIGLFHTRFLEQSIFSGTAGQVGYSGPRNPVIYDLALKSAQSGLNNPEDGVDVIGHELIHVLDLLKSEGKIEMFDGYLPGWTDEQKALYQKARAEEVEALARGKSPMRDYALTNAEEFLAELVSTYFERPNSLKASNPTLYGLMEDYFKQDRTQFSWDSGGNARSPIPRTETILFVGGIILLIGANGVMISDLRHRKRRDDDNNNKPPQ